MNRPVRILYLTNVAEFFVSHRLPLALAAQAAGYEVHVAAPDSPGMSQIARHGIQTHSIVMPRGVANPLGEVLVVYHLYRLYRKVAPDLAHHIAIKPVIYGGMAARLAGVPAVVSAVTGLGHVFMAKGVASFLLRPGVVMAYAMALRQRRGRVIFQNPDDMRQLLSSVRLNEKFGVLVRGSGVDVGIFDQQPDPEGTPLAVLPARMLWTKGVKEFVQAAKQLREQGVQARFALVGKADAGNPAAIDAAQLQAWQSTGDVEWWGHCDDMPEVYRQAHVVCLPSHGEGLPKSLIEAAACGRAIVATDVPGCREIVRDGVNGILVQPGDVSALAGALRKLLADAGLRRRLGERGREIVVEEFSLNHVIAATLAVYHELLVA